jgi:MraZ protein
LQERRLREFPFTKQDFRKFNRLYFSGACEVVCDKQGRVLIPAYLKEYAEIQEDVVIIGVSDRIEIWAKEKWNEFCRQNLNSFEELAEQLIDKPGKKED